ncbi:energy-coupling factor transport system substrate-specific component [Desulfotomaculum arcticum]|uniref:Energy-coupling factor transport system substrate-specific component n=1 Tax=Desulfotruncus arcticus DSM 17038 TaxID=1121424 RepID=A0A1I2T348_9FIRM|nr:ECF transporter S component [Desulfotruncus arcticus]SFG56721.1 energy-coupling factor transport system substrate-specific component [Desulfotomaculum arcticum] [Desulfotruncus arcticus DSM 17038]
MKRLFFTAILILTALLLLLSIIPENPLYNVNWALLSALVVGLSLLAFFWRFDHTAATAKEIALIATMASLAAVSRVPFAVIMSVQPTTFMVMITGYVFGARTGFMVGAVAALVSNFFLGQGPWTPWQMFCWGLCGMSAGLLGRKQVEFKMVPFLLLCGCWGYLFGWIMNIWHWLGFVYPLTLTTFIGTYMASFAFDTLHAAGNIVFSLMLGRSFYQVLTRFKKKFFIIRPATKCEGS